MPRHDRRSRTRSKELQHEQNPEQRHQARIACAKVPIQKRIPLPVARKRLTRKAGYCSSEKWDNQLYKVEIIQ